MIGVAKLCIGTHLARQCAWTRANCRARSLNNAGELRPALSLHSVNQGSDWGGRTFSIGPAFVPCIPQAQEGDDDISRHGLILPHYLTLDLPAVPPVSSSPGIDPPGGKSGMPGVRGISDFFSNKGRSTHEVTLNREEIIDNEQLTPIHKNSTTFEAMLPKDEATVKEIHS